MYQTVHIETHIIEVFTKGTGQPIVLLPGLGSSIEEWRDMIDQLSQHGKVITFHRAGLGGSELGVKTRNAKETANDLLILLKKLEVSAPIILVGHSYGGFCAQYFSFTHPSSVKSLVLIESSSMEFELLDEVIGPQTKQSISMYKALSTFDSQSIKNQLNLQVMTENIRGSDEKKRSIVEFKSNPKMYEAMANELENMSNDAHFLKEYDRLSPIPLLIIGRDPNYSVEIMMKQGMPKEKAESIEEVWQRLIKDQLTLSSNSRYTMAAGAYHNVHETHPSTIINGILSLL
jgi:pimeloyl-ACP methyl ester carboxylesterase